MNIPLPLRAALLCAALFFLPPAVPTLAAPPLESLASILAKHRAATATPAARKPATQETVYGIAAGGLTGTLTEYEGQGGKSRTEMSLGPIQEISGDDGKTAWQQSGGAVRVIRGAELTEKRAASFALDSFNPLKDAARGKVKLRPGRDPETGGWILDVDPTGGVRQTIILDPKTYLVRKVLTRQAGMVGSVTILGYRRIEGVQIPSRMHIGYAGLPLVIEATLQRARRGIVLDPALFAIPRAVNDTTWLTASGRGPASVTFAPDNGEVVVTVAVNGQPRRFLLDTGAATTVLTAGAAQELHLKTEGDLPAVGYGGTTQTGVVSNITLEMPGALRLSGQKVFVLADPKITNTLTTLGNIDGIIGNDLFARFTVTIDYRAKTVALSDKTQPFAPEPGDIVLPVIFDNRTPTVMASLDGKKAARFLVDTGDSSAVHVFTDYARANALLTDPNAPGAEVRQGMGVGGIVQEVITRNHRLALGALTLTDVPISALGGPGISALSDRAGGIGNLLLSKFVVTFDYARQRVILSPPRDFSPSLRLQRPLPLRPGAPLIPGVARPVSSPFVRLAGWESPNPPAPFPQREGGKERKPLLRTPSSLKGKGAGGLGLSTEDVLQKHLDALGGRAAVEAITSTRVTAKVQTGGISGDVLTVFAVPDKEYEQDKLGVLEITQGYDGKSAWRRDSNGNVRPLGSDETRTLRTQLFFDTNSYVVPGRIKGKVTVRPAREPGTGNFILDATPEGGKPSILFLDPKTFLIVKEQHNDDNVVQTTTFRDYRKVDGVQFPFTQTTTNGMARYDVALQVTKIENNVAVPDSLFAPPAASGRFGFALPGAKSATVSFTLEDGEIALPVRINGRAARMYFDSGAAGIALGKDMATALKLPLSGYLEARGYGGSTDLHPVKISTFEVPGAVRLQDVTAVAVPLPKFLKTGKAGPVEGFVGYDLLAHFVIRIDYQKRTLTFMDPASFQPTARDGKEAPLELDNDIPSLSARLDALPDARFLVDTGDPAAVRLYGPYVARNKLAQKYPGGATAYGGGIGGVSLSRQTRTQLFTIAGVSLAHVPTDFSLDSKGGASELFAGAVGSGLLSRFVVTFDYARSRMFLAPVSDATRPFETRADR